YGFPWIQNPSSFTSVGCQLPTEVKFPLLIHLQDNVTVSNGATWANDTLYFTPPSEGTHTVRVIAENSYGADTADVAINVTIDIPMNIDQTDMEFTTTDTSTVMPPAQWIHVNSSCGDGMLNWTVEPHFDVEWLEIDKLSGTNPDSVRVALKGDPGSWAPGIYRATLVFRDIAGRHIQTIPLALFVESGVTVGTQYTQPGRTVTVPVYLHTNDTLRDFTIPLRYFTTQSAAVVVDSVSFSHAIVDTAWIIPDQQIIIVDRDIQPPPMPDSTDSMMVPQTCKVADIHFTVRDFAYDEKVLIDTTTYVAPDDDTLRYRFVLATGDTTVPAFSPGQIIIGEEPPCCVMRGDFTHDWPPELTILDLTSLIAYLFRGGAAPQCLDEADVNADGGVTVGDATMLICIIFRDCQTPLACGVVKSARRAAPEPIASLRTEFDGAATTVILEASEPLMGVQITLQADHPDSIANTTETGLELVHGTVDGLTRVGLLDLQGEVHLPQGSTTLFTVPGEVTLVDGLVADMSHQSMIARIGGKSSSPNLPRRFELAQNYPNPFNPTTVIQFALPVATHVRLEVINILGPTLVDRQMEAGYQSVEWNSTNSDGSRVASGVYFYRLEAGTFRDTKKMLLLK
ncbi:MAG TPA: T9SS type A sorting domain-containing protein, partial [candidate division Zixibacteria bacterium]|nr:T9SS type A sorting domain-containing protein [candidate division Zixibacteria bacterium]